MTGPLTAERVEEALRGLGAARPAGPRRVRFATTPDRLREALGRTVRDLSCDRFIQLASVDAGAEVELHYHLTGPHRTVVSVVVAVPGDRPSAPSVADLLPPAALYERQVHDLMGVEFPGHPDLSRLVLHEGWPAGEHPLRKSWKPGEGGGPRGGGAAPASGSPAGEGEG